MNEIETFLGKKDPKLSDLISKMEDYTSMFESYSPNLQAFWDKLYEILEKEDYELNLVK